MEVVYYAAASLDGYIAKSDGSTAWLAPFEGGSEDYGYADLLGSVDAVLMGAKTYEQTLGFGEWPYSGKRTWVFSSKVPPSARDDVQVTRLWPAEALGELATAGVTRAWLVGGAALAGAFHNAGLITEYVVSVVPVVLGDGVALLGKSSRGAQLELVSSQAYTSGIVQLRYRPRA
jgi:dihydrofolate reductase